MGDRFCFFEADLCAKLRGVCCTIMKDWVGALSTIPREYPGVNNLVLAYICILYICIFIYRLSAVRYTIMRLFAKCSKDDKSLVFPDRCPFQASSDCKAAGSNATPSCSRCLLHRQHGSDPLVRSMPGLRDTSLLRTGNGKIILRLMCASPLKSSAPNARQVTGLRCRIAVRISAKSRISASQRTYVRQMFRKRRCGRTT